MDGFSPKWGFSVSDMGANVLGVGMFYSQQRYWNEQKITFKVSSGKKVYPPEQIVSYDRVFSTIEFRANELFGSSFPERYLKDYNAQTYWLSFNLKSLFNIERMPPWLNIAIGYSGENMFGGYSNVWTNANGSEFDIRDKYQRYKQFLIAPDIDFSRIKFKSHFLKAVFKGLNIFKMPAPALEINTRGEFVFHLLYK